MSSYEYSQLKFAETWGFNMSDCESVDVLSAKLKETSDHMVLVIEEDEQSSFHKIQWINNPNYSGGSAKSKKPGLAELQELL